LTQSAALPFRQPFAGFEPGGIDPALLDREVQHRRLHERKRQSHCSSAFRSASESDHARADRWGILASLATFPQTALTRKADTQAGTKAFWFISLLTFTHRIFQCF
jgi:hypothetical protein